MERKLGIIAGSGDLPRKVIAHCRDQHKPYFVLAIEGQTDSITTENSEHCWIKLGSIGAAIQTLKNAGVRDILMAGPVKRPGWSDIRPDAKGALWLAKLAKNAFGDDSLFRILIELIEKEGFSVIGIETLMGQAILAPQGLMGTVDLDEAAWKDIQHAQKILKLTGEADIGQSLIIQDGVILGIEAAEGTNELIRRCQHLHRPGPGGILLKMTKPWQERRVDLPTIGIETIQLASDHGLRGIAVESGSVQILQKEECTTYADKKGLFLIGIPHDRAYP